VSGHLAREFMSLILQLVLFMGRHEHWLLHVVRPHHPRLFRWSVDLYFRAWAVVNHWPSSNVLRPGP